MVCRQLGFPNQYPEVIRDAFYGTGSGPIWLNDFRCNGSEKFLVDCKIEGWRTFGCTHLDDVGVNCTGRSA